MRLRVFEGLLATPMFYSCGREVAMMLWIKLHYTFLEKIFIELAKMARGFGYCAFKVCNLIPKVLPLPRGTERTLGTTCRVAWSERTLDEDGARRVCKFSPQVIRPKVMTVKNWGQIIVRCAKDCTAMKISLFQCSLYEIRPMTKWCAKMLSSINLT